MDKDYKEENMSKRIGFIVGSLRKASYNLKVVNTLIELLPEGYEGEIIEIRDLPMYNEEIDQEGNTSEEYTKFRNHIKEVDALVFATPEYNRTMSGAIKNAVDVATRPSVKSSVVRKKAAVVASSLGNTGGAIAFYELKKLLVAVNMEVMGHPDVFLSAVHESFDEEGKAPERTKEFLQKFVDALVKFVG